MTSEPSSIGSVRFPAAYGTPGGPDSLLPWGHVEERMRAASNYWITTVAPSARPHARPVDGVWVDGALCFGGSPETRWVRNLMANPSISVHLSSEAEAIILEGTAEYVTDPSHPLAAPSAAASKEKYPQYFSGDAPPFRPFWALRPTTAFAWTLEGFPRGATRWRFEKS
ncbi:MAG TPA: pyridoxamine 5'-phosphate oxidase family protein [Candidatus Limnocylindria bacterium]|nr:pyridoxamine 5'-phosphate oxidase family protein [Candidatus Limnocylindria bacterium]